MQNYEDVTMCNILLSTGAEIKCHQVLEDDTTAPMLIIKPHWREEPIFVNRAHIVTIEYFTQRVTEEG